MTASDPARAAELLLQARATRQWLDALPDGARPKTETEAYAIQDTVARHLGPVVGWKVGSATLHSEPFRAPIHSSTLRIEDPRLPAAMFHVIGVEAEIVYHFARDLPPRATTYTRDEVLAAVDAIHPAVEIVDTRFAAFGSVDLLSQRADQQNHGALSVGPALRNWSGIDPIRQGVQLMINGEVRFNGPGENSAVDPVRLLVWMANHGTHAHGGLRAGQVVTTGSCTGTIFVEPGAHVSAVFPGLGAIDLTIS
jgi:2-keto-4-pentenoate hydratase